MFLFISIYLQSWVGCLVRPQMSEATGPDVTNSAEMVFLTTLGESLMNWRFTVR